MQTGGQVSSAPVRRSSGAGRECLAPEGSPRLAPTRASSASSSSYTLREVTRFPLPPGPKNVFFCTALPAAPGPSAEIAHAYAGNLAQVQVRRCWSRRGRQPKSSVRGCWPSGKLGVPREGKRILQESFTPTENARPHPLKAPGQASPCSQATLTPRYSASEGPQTHKGQHTLACGRSASVRMFPYTRLSLPGGGNSRSSLQSGLGGDAPRG